METFALDRGAPLSFREAKGHTGQCLAFIKPRLAMWHCSYRTLQQCELFVHTIDNDQDQMK